MLFLIILQYIKPQVAINTYFGAHEAFLRRYTDTGQFILAGQKVMKNGEFILCKAQSRREIETILREDPFDVYQLAVYETIAQVPLAYAAGLEQYLG